LYVNRRTFLAGAAGAAASALTGRGAQAVRITVDTRRKLGSIPDDFLGLGYEISSVAIPGLLSAQNRTYVQLVRAMGSAGVIRIGGNTSDYASFAPTAPAISAPKGTVVNSASLRELGTFLDATGWKLIWGLNLGSGSEQLAVEESVAVAAAVKNKLLAFEIGNEPDLFGRRAAHRPDPYTYSDYLKEYRRYKRAIRAKLPDAPFAGPDAAGATDWVTRFAADEGSDLKLLTHHYYRECAGPASTLDKLLHPDPKLAPELAKLSAASEASRVPYRICETNSFCGGGKPGVSDTLGAALWVLDFMFRLASAGCAGVNIETGVNQLGFISSYSPIAADEHGNDSAKPAYYGMLAFAQGGRGQGIAINYDAGDINLTAYAVIDRKQQLSVTMINKDTSRDAHVTVATTGSFSNAELSRLSGPSLESKQGITLGDVTSVPSKGGQCEVHVPAASAAILRWRL
jgi:hypothetical protein